MAIIMAIITAITDHNHNDDHPFVGLKSVNGSLGLRWSPVVYGSLQILGLDVVSG